MLECKQMPRLCSLCVTHDGTAPGVAWNFVNSIISDFDELVDVLLLTLQ